MEFQKEVYPLRGQNVVTVKVEINGVRGRSFSIRGRPMSP